MAIRSQLANNEEFVKASAGKLSSFRAEIEVNGATQAADRLSALGYRAYNTFPLMNEIKQLLFEQQKRRVESRPWTPLTEKTIANKTAQGENVDIFHDEWRMIKGSATRTGNALWYALTLDGAAHQIKRATRATATFGVDSKGNGKLFYARFVQNVSGTKRKILAISQADALEITMAVTTYIDRAWEIGVASGKEWRPAGNTLKSSYSSTGSGFGVVKGGNNLGQFALPTGPK